MTFKIGRYEDSKTGESWRFTGASGVDQRGPPTFGMVMHVPHSGAGTQHGTWERSKTAEDSIVVTLKGGSQPRTMRVDATTGKIGELASFAFTPSN